MTLIIIQSKEQPSHYVQKKYNLKTSQIRIPNQISYGTTK